jgi:hypothetical protein
LNDCLPLWPLLPICAWLLWRCRREAWFAPVAWWGGFLALGTLLTIPSPEVRYLAPLELGVYFSAAVAVLCILARRLGAIHSRETASPRPSNTVRM